MTTVRCDNIHCDFIENDLKICRASLLPVNKIGQCALFYRYEGVTNEMYHKVDLKIEDVTFDDEVETIEEEDKGCAQD